MADLTIRTNNQPRDVLYWHELTDKERAEFDYLGTEERQQDASFARYKGDVYDLGEFMRICEMDDSFNGWHGYASDTYFSGTLVKFIECNERVVMGNYYF